MITPFCWNENAGVRVKQNLCLANLQIALWFENNICPKRKLHLPLKIAIFKIQNSILSQKCSLFKTKLAFTVENQV